ncbi:MAG: NAD(P)/FAD-dependent oxidoreductase [Pyrinomonadaceae bacterium]
MKKDVIIIGGGAAGLFCAMVAGKRGRSVLVLEHGDTTGKKIAISGGGRCNFTNLNTTPDNFISANPHFAKSALARYTPEDFVALVSEHGIAYHEKKLGQLFCDKSAGQITAMLLEECAEAGVEVLVNCEVGEVLRDSVFRVGTSRGVFTTGSLVVATGGLSIPKIGATDFGYRVAQQFDLKIIPPAPALVPLTLSTHDLSFFSSLSGVSVPAIVRGGGAEFAENILMTHRGMSGPAILQISSYWSQGETLSIELLPGVDTREIFAAHHDGNAEAATSLALHLPRRFAQTWCELYAPSKPLNRYTTTELAELSERLHDWRVKPFGTEGFAKAEVTKGGVDSGELSSKTMEARRVPGLFFIGEVVDVTGQLGGYNFQWAWASGYAAGQCV